MIILYDNWTLCSFNKKVDVRTFRKVTASTIEPDAVTNQSSRGVEEKNYDKLQSSVNVREENREIDLSILSQKGAPTYLDFKTKDEYKYNSPEIQKLQTELRPAEKKFSKLRSLFRKDFRRKNICYLFLYFFLSLSNILKILL